jgi:5S rRNA maturation endonuclease (ribonuclease M5)
MGMTWISVCSGQLGIYQETIMTDEERQKLIARLKSHEVVMWTDIDLAADEIERLATELEKYKKLYSETEEAGWEGMPG